MCMTFVQHELWDTHELKHQDQIGWLDHSDQQYDLENMFRRLQYLCTQL